MSTVELPSTRIWWDFESRAIRPPSSPSTKYISQSGRVAVQPPRHDPGDQLRSWSIEPGRGSAERRTW